MNGRQVPERTSTAAKMRLRLSWRAASKSSPSDRKIGDQFRNISDWPNAAAAYERHLQVKPDDHAIWTQLGHARKESGDLLGAHAAYGRALAIEPNDADLLLQIGHLTKLQGRMAAATGYYLKSARLAPSGRALGELESMRSEWFAESQRAELASIIATRFAERATGVSINAFEARRILKAENPVRTDGAWIDLSVSDTIDSDFGLLTLSADFAQPSCSAGRLLVDYGSGLCNFEDFHMQWGERRSLDIPIFLRGLRQMRWLVPQLNRLDDVISIQLTPIATSQLAILDPGSFAKMLDRAANTKDNQEASDKALQIQRLVQPIRRGPTADASVTEYQQWLRLWTGPLNTRPFPAPGGSPKVSFILPIFRPELGPLIDAIDSILDQDLGSIEICAADDTGSPSEISALLDGYAKSDPRFRLVRRSANGNISAATNSAIGIARGKYLVFVDQDDVVSPDCAHAIVDAFESTPSARVVYSDEDKIDLLGRRVSPHMKGAFDPLLLLGQNSIGHVFAIDHELCTELGGCRLGFEGAQDHDLALRALEAVGPEAFTHVAKVLYHWRESLTSSAMSVEAKPYAHSAMLMAVNGYLERAHLDLVALPGVAPGRVRLMHTGEGRASITAIILNAGNDTLISCLASIVKADYADLEVVVLTTFELSASEQAFIDDLDVAHSIRRCGEHELSRARNNASAAAAHDLILMVESTLIVTRRDCLDRASALFSLPRLGMLGGRVMRDTATIESFGLVFQAGGDVAQSIYRGSPTTTGQNFDKNRLLQSVSAVEMGYFIRRSLVAEIGGLDPGLAGRDADIDLSLKVWAAGYSVAVDPDIEAVLNARAGDLVHRAPSAGAELLARWGDRMLRDPFYSTNLDLHRPGQLAHPPRTMERASP